MRQNSGQMRQKPFVDCKKPFCPDRFKEAVEDAFVQVAVLVVQAGHDGV